MKKSLSEMHSVKTLSVALLLVLALPGCSRFTAAGRMDRAYYKHMKEVKAQREKRNKRLVEHQRAEMPSLRSQSPPPLQETVVTQPDGQ